MEDKENLNILIFSWRGPKHPNAGGAEVSTHEHTKGWVNANYNVTLFTAAFKGCKEYEVIDGVNIIRRGRQILGVQWEAFRWYLFGKHTKFDLVIDQFHGIPFFTPLYIYEKKLAFIHEVTREVWSLNPWPWPFNLLPAIAGTIFEPFIFKLFYKKIPFMTVSNSTKRDLISWEIPSKNITVIHNGVSIPKDIHISKKEKEKTLIFLGALSRDKGIEDALRVFSIVNKKDDKYRFWVIGKGEENYLIRLKEMANKLGILNKVIFYGFVSERKKFNLLSKAHLLINTSIREGWGLVVIEAAYVGTPTVGYNVVGLRDSVVDSKTGVLSQPNPKDCAREAISLMNNEKRHSILRENCREWSKKFDWDMSVNKSLKLISNILKH